MCDCHSKSNRTFDRNTFLSFLGVILGLLTGYFQFQPLMTAATILSSLFITLFKLVSLPIIFLSIVSTASGMKNIEEIKFLGLRVLRYTILTTVISATVALGMFLLYDPVRVQISSNQTAPSEVVQGSYWNYLAQLVPSNFLQPFIENNVISVMFLALGLSLAIITLHDHHRETLHGFFTALYSAIMKIILFIIGWMPLAVWSFVTLFVRDWQEGLEISSIAYYLAAVLSANLLQGCLVLPLFLKLKGISPLKLVKAMAPALTLAFFSKSSSATLPLALSCAENRGGISGRVANFSFPLCTSINMNGCAAFILITVLFVSMSHGVNYTLGEMVVWIAVSTIAAIGNAGVPMGCYFLASAFLAAMDIPLHIMGIILPFYTLIDMVETSVNVWSDTCVTAAVQVEVDHFEKSVAST